MKGNSFAAENLYNDKENYYTEKRLSVFGAVSVGGSFLINVLIIGYAIVSAIISSLETSLAEIE